MELTLRNADFEAHKTLRNASCEALTDAAALLLAMALNPSAVPAASTSANADGDEDGDAATPRSRVERRSGGTPPGRDRQRSHPSGSEREPRGHGSRSAHATPRQPDAESRFAWPDVAFGLGADAGLQTGMLPQTPAPGLRAQLVLGVGRLRTAAAVALWPSTRTAAEGHWRGQLDAHGWVAAFEISWRLVPARLQLGPTVLLERGELSVASIGVSAPASAATIWTAAGFGLYGAYALADGFALTAEALAITPFARPRWVLRTPRGDVAAFTADAVGLRLYTGVAYVFE